MTSQAAMAASTITVAPPNTLNIKFLLKESSVTSRMKIPVFHFPRTSLNFSISFFFLIVLFVFIDFYNWNRVKVRYCDGASFTGDTYNTVSTITYYIVSI